MQSIQPRDLIALRVEWVTATDMAVAMGIDRTTLWKRENHPQTAPRGWWDEYRQVLQDQISPQAQNAVQALEMLGREVEEPVAA